MQIRSALSLLTFSCVLALQAGDLSAAEVFKCVVNGRTVYQDGPCKGKGTSLNIDAEVTREQHQDAIRRAHKDRQQSSTSGRSTNRPDRGAQHVTENASDPEAAATRKAIADCESQRGVDCTDPREVEQYRIKNTPLTPEQQQQADRMRRERKAQEEPWNR